MLANKSENGSLYPRAQRLYCVQGERKTASLVGVQISNRRVRAMRGKRDCKTAGRDRKNDIQKTIERMRCMLLCSGLPVRSRSSERGLFP
jgi:hypothetical protein